MFCNNNGMGGNLPMRKAYLIGNRIMITETNQLNSILLNVNSIEGSEVEVVLSKDEWQELMSLSYTINFKTVAPIEEELSPPF